MMLARRCRADVGVDVAAHEAQTRNAATRGRAPLIRKETYMKKIVLVASAAVLAFGLFALAGCGKDEPEVGPGGTNPMTEVDADGLVEATGIALTAPEGAEDVKYFAISMDDGYSIAEMQFTMDGVEYCQRAASTDLTEFPMTAEEAQAAYAESMDVANDADLTGMYYQWESVIDGTVSACPAQVYTETTENAAIVLWLDVAPGLNYSLSAVGVDADTILATANAVYVPLQGEA